LLFRGLIFIFYIVQVAVWDIIDFSCELLIIFVRKMAVNNQTFPKKKHPAIAALLTIIFGPFGYLYIGWRYALAAVICFVLFVILFTLVAFIPVWLKYVNVLFFAFLSVQICQIRNMIINEKHSDAFAFNTFPVAIFAMTILLPLLATVDTAVIGIFAAIRAMIDGNLSKGLVILFLATPVISFVHYFVFSWFAFGIDKLVLLFAPNAPTNIFPTAAIRHKKVS